MSDRAYKLQNYPLSWPDDWKRTLAKEMHPDSPTGSHDAMAALNSAKEQAIKEIEAQ